MPSSAPRIHLSILLPNDGQLAATGHQYFSRAVAKHREALAIIDRFIADPLCLSSVVIMFLTFKIACQRAAQERHSAPIEWFRIMNGMGRLIRLSSSLREGGGMQLLLQQENTSATETTTAEEVLPVQDLNALLLHTEGLDNDVLDAESKARRQSFWDCLSQLLSVVVAGALKYRLQRRLLGLAATREERFLRLVELEDTLTMILLAHYFALFKWTGGNWWLQSSLDMELDRH
jgi:hypothetical protein